MLSPLATCKWEIILHDSGGWQLITIAHVQHITLAEKVMTIKSVIRFSLIKKSICIIFYIRLSNGFCIHSFKYHFKFQIAISKLYHPGSKQFIIQFVPQVAIYDWDCHSLQQPMLTPPYYKNSLAFAMSCAKELKMVMHTTAP